MIRRFLAATILFLAMGTSVVRSQESEIPDEFLTVAEKSEYKATSLSLEVEQFIDLCDAKSDLISKFEYGRTVDGKPMTAVVLAKGPYEAGKMDDRFRALVIGNIHSGECDGKEGLLEIIRNVAIQSKCSWLDNMVVIIAPNYNADGNDKVAATNRRGQVGPENGMGVRANSQQLDLNRDFVKLESPEAQNLIRLIDKAKPHLFIDCHTTNGSKHRYPLTYDVPHNPSSPPMIRKFMRDSMMPDITSRMKGKNIDTFYYGNFDRTGKRWESYGFEPRYSTEYFGMRGGLAVLSESYSYATYKERIDASREFVKSCLDYCHDHADPIKQLIDDSRSDFMAAAKSRPASVTISLDAKMVPFAKPEVILAYNGSEPAEIEVEFWSDFEPITTTSLPFAYLLPAQLKSSVEKLKQHGIQVEELSSDMSFKIEFEVIKALNRSQQPFQNHSMVRLETTQDTGERTFPAGTSVVRTAQPLGRLASYMLEARSNDGLATWNFLDDELEVDGEFPIVRILAPIEFK